MRFLGWHLALSAWLLLSAFALGHSSDSIALTALFAVLFGTFAFAAKGVPTVRFVNALLAIALAWAALLMTDSSAIARANNVLVAALVFALSVAPSRAWGTEPHIVT